MNTVNGAKRGSTIGAESTRTQMNTDSITYLATVQVEEVYTAENSETQTAQEAN